jgi:pseudaminic acid biosynthesis-associated methylase
MDGTDAVTKTTQLEAWTGAFGQAYLERNCNTDEADMGPRTACWSNVVRSMPEAPASILEVGSNIGRNLVALGRLCEAELHAVEPFEDAFSQLAGTVGDRLTSSHNCTGFELPFEDNSIDFVFTSGVLIHIAPADLPRIMSEVVRVSKRYVLCNEYFAKSPEEIQYRGHQGLLFKRDFGRYYTEQWPALKPLNTGFFWLGNSPFDDTTWWLFEKV